MATDRIFKWSGFAKGLSDSMAQAMQRRLEQQYQQESQVDLLSYLPDHVRQALYPDRKSLPVDPSQLSPLLGHYTNMYKQVTAPSEEPTAYVPGSFFPVFTRALETGDWSEYERLFGDMQIPTSDAYRVLGGIAQMAGAGQKLAETRDLISRIGMLDTPITQQEVSAFGLPTSYVGMTPRQILGIQDIQTGIREEESHEDARLMAALERAAKELGIEVTKQELQQSAALFEPLLRQEQARADQMEFEAQKAPEQYELSTQKLLQEIQNLAAQGQLTSLQAQLLSQALPDLLRQEAAKADTMEAEARRSQIEADLLAEFGRQREQLALRAAEVGIALDEATLDRLLKTTDAVVAKAVAEASLAQTEAQTQEALAPIVIEQAKAELENLHLQNQIDSAEYEAMLQLLPIQVEQALETLKSIQLQNKAAEWQLQLSQAFDEKYMIEGLKKLELENLRQAVGLQMDQAELERFVKLTDPIVQKAVAEAAVADIEALFKQETYETMVAQVEAELQAQLTANKISEQEYELALQLAPYRVQQAVEELLSLQLQNEARELENQYARDTLPQRIQLVSEQLRNLELEQQKTEMQISELRRQIAMAQRTDPLRVAQLEAELENTKLRNQQLAIQIEQLEQQAAAYQGLDAEDRDFAFKLYQAENEVFRGQSVWIPPFAEYVANMMSESPLDWNIYVTLYDAEMRQSIGPPPEGDALDFPWMSQEWQNLYKKELDNYIATLPDSQWLLRQAPFFPSMAVFYGNYMSGNPMDLDELIQRYNDGTIPQYIYDIAFGRPVSGIVTSRGRMDELINDLPNIFPGLSSNEDILNLLQSGHPEIQSLMAKIEEIYGVTGDELIAELRRR